MKKLVACLEKTSTFMKNISYSKDCMSVCVCVLILNLCLFRFGKSSNLSGLGCEDWLPSLTAFQLRALC